MPFLLQEHRQNSYYCLFRYTALSEISWSGMGYKQPVQINDLYSTGKVILPK